VRGCASKKTLFALEQARADVAHRRRRWRSWQAGLDPRRLVFIDETWIKTSMAPLRGWGPRGERVRGFAPHGHWRTLTFLGALRCDSLAAPCVFDGPINGECFRAYVEQQLVPVLKPGDIVIMDNPASHHPGRRRQALWHKDDTTISLLRGVLKEQIIEQAINSQLQGVHLINNHLEGEFLREALRLMSGLRTLSDTIGEMGSTLLSEKEKLSDKLK